MNCQHCHKDVPTPCRNSDDLAGCVRFHDPIAEPEVKPSNIGLMALEGLQYRIYEAEVMANSVVGLGMYGHAYQKSDLDKLKAIEAHLRHSAKVVQAMLHEAKGVGYEQKD